VLFSPHSSSNSATDTFNTFTISPSSDLGLLEDRAL